MYIILSFFNLRLHHFLVDPCGAFDISTITMWAPLGICRRKKSPQQYGEMQNVILICYFDNVLLQKCTVTSYVLKCATDNLHMMTSSNGNIFRVTGHLCGEITGHRWLTQGPVTRSFGIFYDLRLNKRLSKQWRGCWFESKRRQTETSTTKTSTNRNVDKPKRRQTETSTNRNVDKPKRRQTKTSTDQNVDRPKRRQTETSTNQNVDKPKRRQTKTSTLRNLCIILKIHCI